MRREFEDGFEGEAGAVAEDLAAVTDEPGVGGEGAGGGADAEPDVGGDGAAGEHPVGGEGLGEADGPRDGEIGDAGNGVADVGDDWWFAGRGGGEGDEEAEEPGKWEEGGGGAGEERHDQRLAEEEARCAGRRVGLGTHST